MKDLIVSEVARGGGVSFAELMRIPGARGDLGMSLGDPNMILWSGVSQEFVDGLNAARREKLIEPASSTPLVYYVDGEALDLPIAKKPPASGYKKPHWIPVVFWLHGRVPGRLT